MVSQRLAVFASSAGLVIMMLASGALLFGCGAGVLIMVSRRFVAFAC